jgi:hypothetical protein
MLHLSQVVLRMETISRKYGVAMVVASPIMATVVLQVSASGRLTP